MNYRPVWYNKRFIIVASLFITFLFILPSLSTAYTRKERDKFQRSIVDFRSRLNPRFKKVKRKNTKYIVVHTSELGLKTTLRVVSKGKRFRSGRRTNGGHTHYVIARNGRTYRILDKKYVADHAGLQHVEWRDRILAKFRLALSWSDIIMLPSLKNSINR